MKAQEAQNARTYASTRAILIAVTIASLLIAAAAALWLALSITKGLAGISALASAVSMGDLNKTIDITSNDEMKDLVDTVNVMTGKLRSVVGSALGASDNVSSGSQQLSATA